jgi:hypothetical protein
MDTDQFTNTSSRSGARIGRCLDCADVATNKDGDIACADIFFSEQLHIRGFHHCIGGFDCAHESFGFNHSESF